VIRPAVLCCAVDASLLRVWCVVGARSSKVSAIVARSRLRPSGMVAPAPGSIQVHIHRSDGCSRHGRAKLSRTETQYLEGIFRGIAEWQQGGNMLPLCCLLVATLLPLLFVEARREVTKPATRCCFHGIHLPATAQLALTRSVPVVATFLADFDPSRI
jgi:hypothetical protein